MMSQLNHRSRKEPTTADPSGSLRSTPTQSCWLWFKSLFHQQTFKKFQYSDQLAENMTRRPDSFIVAFVMSCFRDSFHDRQLRKAEEAMHKEEEEFQVLQLWAKLLNFFLCIFFLEAGHQIATNNREASLPASCWWHQKDGNLSCSLSRTCQQTG